MRVQKENAVLGFPEKKQKKEPLEMFSLTGFLTVSLSEVL